VQVLIVTEGLYGTGYGHLTRCLSIAQAFTERGVDPHFIANIDDAGSLYLEDQKVSKYNWIEDNSKLYNQLKGTDIAFLDSYHAPHSIYETISMIVKQSVYLDDYHRMTYPKGIVLNGSMGAESMQYPSTPGVQHLLGKDYILLRKEFWDVPARDRSGNVSNVLILLGGQDIRNLSIPILNRLRESHPAITYHIVLAPNQITPGTIDSNTVYYQSLDAAQMRDLMLKCDIAISAAGQTINELMRIGIPTVAVAVADNQRGHADRFTASRAPITELWHEIPGLLDEIETTFQHYLSKEITELPIIDGQGARRVANALLSLFAESAK
jgi:spore coat polysaccharide biosynthesis predicted glycosyltransferase SpsG